MVVLTCRVQYLDDSDPFAYENFPQPRKPLPYELDENVALSEQIAGVHRLLEPPLKLEDCTLQRTASGSYLDVELSLAEQRDDLEQLYEDIANGKKPILILRTQLSVRVHSILEKLYNSHGPELRRSLFSLKQLFEDDKDLVPEFVNSEGLACFIKVGAEADHNYQNYILRALSQIMLFVDGMNGVINHNETVQWLYTLTGSLSRLVVKMALKLLIVFVEYTQSNALLLIQAVNTVDDKRGVGSWSYLIEILEERNLSDCELLIYTMSLINKTLAALPDQDSFYDVTDCLEEQGMESIMEKHMNNKETESELKQQFAIYENALKYEDGEVEEALPNIRKERRKVAQCAEEGRRSRRSVGQSPTEMLTLASSIFSPAFQSPNRSLDEMASPQVSEPSTPESAKAMPSISESGSQGSSPLLPHVSSNGTALSPAESENSTPVSQEHSFVSQYFSPVAICKKSLTKDHSPVLSSPTPTDSTPQEKQPHPLADQPPRTEGRGIFNPDVCNVKSDKPVLKKFEDTFLSNLVATELEKRRKQPFPGPTPDEPKPQKEDFSPEPNTYSDPTEKSVTSLTPAGRTLQQQDSVTEICSTLSNDKKFMLDMLYARSAPETMNKLENQEEKSAMEVGAGMTKVSEAQGCFSAPQAWKRLGNKQKQWLRPQCSIDAEMHSSNLEKTLMMPLSRDSQHTVDGLQPSSIILKIKDLDFSDLQEEEDIDVLDIDSFDSDMSPPPPMAGLGTPPPPPLPPPFGSIGMGSPPPPPPPPLPCGGPLNPPPPPPPPSPHGISPLSPTMSQDSALIKKKKTVKLFWKELKQSDSPSKSTFGHGTIWASLDKVAVDTAKLEHLFESKAKEIPLGRKGSEGKKPEIHILDPKRSNAINIGMTVLPPIHVIKSAIMNFDEFAINKEGIEKILTMVPTEEEKQKIQEAQLVNPDIPLGKAEQFLLTLSSISALNARLQLWSFKLNYDVLEKEIAEPLFDLKLGMTQLASNATFQRILATLLAVGNFLNNSNAKGFDLSYLEKVTEVKDTVHRQSLLHHICSFVVENYPDSSDVYSEIPAITRSAKIDFEQLSDNLIQLERKCKTSWNNLKVMAKHETKVLLRNRMTDFLKDCTERIIILKVVHRRIINRFHSFLLYLGQPSYSVRETKVTHFCKIIGEFSLEYRTTRERVLTHKRKREAFRERTKTRGKLITETEKFSNAVASEAHDSLQPASTSPEPRLAQEEHENMKNMLIASMNPSAPRHSRSIRSLGSTMASSMSTFKEDSSSDATDEIMDLLVKSVTQTPAERPSSPKTRKRSRVNRKSLRRTLKNGLSSEEMVQALSFSKQSEQV
ncbi:FH1/FH2 domain-containing protein 1-like isoform X2 [Scleropages formosus]|uniref:FH1/FH2 domain-containing protein 1-like isoform X2 n=1 Tax=Scleropages formosus TaxID=113540 RepID=UPI0010FAC927|nr:FH1/FH2 domain-containing protein 1-like isoform X2 [Scleropages formosus]